MYFKGKIASVMYLQKIFPLSLLLSKKIGWKKLKHIKSAWNYLSHFAPINDEKYIKKQLEFILNQTLPIDEIIICDDRSQDNTIQLIKELKIRQKNHSFSYERSFINRFSTNRKIKKSQYPNSQYSIFHVAEFL